MKPPPSSAFNNIPLFSVYMTKLISKQPIESKPTVTLSQTSFLFNSPTSRINLVGENKGTRRPLPHYHH